VKSCTFFFSRAVASYPTVSWHIPQWPQTLPQAPPPTWASTPTLQTCSPFSGRRSHRVRFPQRKKSRRARGSRACSYSSMSGVLIATRSTCATPSSTARRSCGGCPETRPSSRSTSAGSLTRGCRSTQRRDRAAPSTRQYGTDGWRARWRLRWDCRGRIWGCIARC
jgi:hypothetical protein